MASMVTQALNQIRKNGYLNLFKSYKPEYPDGEQKRDFIYVKDVVRVIYNLMNNNGFASGYMNVGTGAAKSFNELAISVFDVLGKKATITYCDMPEELKDKYQYYTEAETSRLQYIFDKNQMFTIDKGVVDYINDNRRLK
jgi:ADP-L-glycero-D-manno-heptose 6-epimerase